MSQARVSEHIVFLDICFVTRFSVRGREALDDSVFDSNATFSVTCRDGGSFPSISTCSEPTFSFVAVVRDAIVASSFAGAVITWETVFGHGKDFFDGCRVTGFSKRASQVDW